MSNNPRFDLLLEKMQAIHNAKNADYATALNPFSNFEEAAASAGVTVDQVFAVLMGIKMARIKELTSSGKTPNNESLQDSRLDLAVYAALRASYHEVAVPNLPTVGNGGNINQVLGVPSKAFTGGIQ